MDEIDEIFTKVYNEDQTKIFRLKLEWEKDFFRLFIIETTNAWFALVTKDVINNFAEQHGIDIDMYHNKLREYLCSKQPDISFDLVDKQFYVYRGSLKQKLRFKYFFVKLEEMNYQETVEEFIDKLATNYTNVLQKVKQVEDTKLEVENQRNVFEKLCDDFIELKRTADLKMYSAFTLILNEKKHRIRYLTELLEEYTGGRKTKVSITNEEENEKTFKQMETISDSDSEAYNTDDEKNIKLSDIDMAQAGPSNVENNFDILGSDSPPPPSIPKRIKTANQTCTPVESSIKETNVIPTLKNDKIKKSAIEILSEDSDEESNKFSTLDLLERM